MVRIGRLGGWSESGGPAPRTGSPRADSALNGRMLAFRNALEVREEQEKTKASIEGKDIEEILAPALAVAAALCRRPCRTARGKHAAGRADLILTGAKIWTGDPAQPEAIGARRARRADRGGRRRRRDPPASSGRRRWTIDGARPARGRRLHRRPHPLRRRRLRAARRRPARWRRRRRSSCAGSASSPRRSRPDAGSPPRPGTTSGGPARRSRAANGSIRGRFRESLQVGEKDVAAAAQANGNEKLEVEAFEYQLQPVVLIVPQGSAPAAIEARRKEAEALRSRVQTCEEANALFKSMQNAAIRERRDQDVGRPTAGASRSARQDPDRPSDRARGDQAGRRDGCAVRTQADHRRHAEEKGNPRQDVCREVRGEVESRTCRKSAKPR